MQVQGYRQLLESPISDPQKVYLALRVMEKARAKPGLKTYSTFGH